MFQVSRLIFILGLITSFRAWGAPLSLTETLRLALQSSPVYDVAEKTQTVDELQYKNSVAKLLPSIDFTTTDGLQNNIDIASNTDLLYTANPTSPWYSTLTLGLSETLYDNGVSLTNLSIASLTRDFARLNSLKARDSLVLSIATEFYTFSLSSELLNARKEQVSLLDKQFDILSSQYKQGFKLRADYLRLKSQVQQAQINEAVAEDTIAQSVATLRQLLGTNLTDSGSTVFNPVPVSRNEHFTELETVTNPDLTGFYDTRLTRIQEEINDRTVDLSWRNYYPQVSLVSGVAYSNQSFVNSQQPFATGHQLSWNALVTVQYNLWDWGTRNRNVTIAQNNRDISNDGLNQSLQQTYANVEQMAADFHRIRRNYGLIEQLLSMEEESNHLVEQQYREGKVTYLDLITSLNNLLQAKVQFYTAYYEVLTNLAKDHYYKGSIYESLVKE